MIVGISGLLIDESGTPVGSAGSGKDTLADMLPSTQKISFADPVKRTAQSLYEFTDEQLWGPSQRRNEPDSRYPRNHTWVSTVQTHGFRGALDLVAREGSMYSCACCGAIVGSLGDRPDNDAAAQCYLTPRYALQLIGTEAGRQCYQDTWVEIAHRTATRLIASKGDLAYTPTAGLQKLYGITVDPPSTVAIPDVRFKNEVDGLRIRGVKLVRVKRIGKGLKNAAGLHPSEREVAEIPDSKFDMVIENDGSLSDLRAKVPQILSLLS